jgi:hypothetical protein
MTGPVRYQRNPAVNETELDGEIFLVEPTSEDVFYLDTIGAGLWRLIAVPQTVEEAIAVYHAAFPDIDRQTVEHDLRTAFQTLIDQGLVVVAR